MIRKNNLEDITDEEFEKIVMPHDNLIYDYIRDNILYEYIAYYLASGYEQSALWECELDRQINSAIETLCGFYLKDKFNYSILKTILEKKYNLRIIDKTTSQMAKIK